VVILQVNKFFYEKGGSERYLFMQRDALTARGHRVIDFSMQHPDNLPSPHAHHFVPNRDYGGGDRWRALRDGGSFIRSREAAARVDALIGETRPDVAHLHNIYHQITPSILPVLARHGIPVFMTLHDYKLVCPNYTLFANGAYCERCLQGHFHHAVLERCHEGSLARSALLALEAWWQRTSGVYDAVSTFFAPSRFMRDLMIRAGFEPSRVVYLPSFIPEPAPGTAPPAIPFEAGRYLLYAGRLSHEKGIATLLRALDDATPLVVCGDGPLRASLETQARERGLRVYFAGHVAKDRLDAITRGALAAVLPAEWPENAPFAVLEAAVLGTPVIVSNMGGLPEMAECVGGVVFDAGNAGALRDAIRALAAQPEAARARARAGRVRALAHYHRDAHLHALEAAYRQALEAAA
jgi:glycosyltransferase involved in cell wall biosynthesis